ncbi:MAG: hypothetical protein ACAH21_01575 [Ramlibacter sp.]|nr:hypothetical protein [Ramlibacter sp.]
MIRFLPDTWRDALWRPLSMASPDGGVYVEILAPDFRFLFVLVLALAWLLFARGGQRRISAAAPVLLAFTALAFVPWLVTTGNGRYFIPFLLLAGPLCIGLLHLLPITRGFRLALALGMVLWQGVVIHEVDPWRTWAFIPWKDAPAFGVDVPADVAAQPATYVTVASISYSLIAPRFHPDSRWINISSLQGVGSNAPDEVRARALLNAPGPLNLLFPTVPGGQEGERIDPDLGLAIDDLLVRQGLSIEDGAKCRLLRSSGLANMISRRQRETPAENFVHGFWLCPLTREASPRARKAGPVPERTEQVFERLEKTCPRIFRPGETVSLRLPGGAVRGYPGSDFKLYVLDDGQVWYKYVRALNPVLLGKADGILGPSFTMDCDNIKGRSGLPWERGI